MTWWQWTVAVLGALELAGQIGEWMESAAPAAAAGEEGKR